MVTLLAGPLAVRVVVTRTGLLAEACEVVRFKRPVPLNVNEPTVNGIVPPVLLLLTELVALLFTMMLLMVPLPLTVPLTTVTPVAIGTPLACTKLPALPAAPKVMPLERLMSPLTEFGAAASGGPSRKVPPPVTSVGPVYVLADANVVVPLPVNVTPPLVLAFRRNCANGRRRRRAAANQSGGQNVALRISAAAVGNRNAGDFARGRIDVRDGSGAKAITASEHHGPAHRCNQRRRQSTQSC